MSRSFVLGYGAALSVVGVLGCSHGPSDDGEQVANAPDAVQQHKLANNVPFSDPSGFFSTVSSNGFIDLTNEFFQDLGTNGRRCVSCHVPEIGWTITPTLEARVFEETAGGVVEDSRGLGAIFRTNDGSSSPDADVSTLDARRRAYSMLLRRGLIRVGIGVPANADYELVAVDDPYGFASAAELSLFRRPLPSTNVRFLSTVMFDGRETLAGTDHCNAAAEGGACFASIHADLVHQANSATLTHAQGSRLTHAQRESIVGFVSGLATAQVWDEDARYLNAAGARGGPAAIAGEASYYGINDNLGDYATKAPFSPHVFTLYEAWAVQPGKGGAVVDARAAVARGEALFNTRPITISGVAGLNGSVGSPFNPPLPDSFVGACTTCHDAPNAGNHSIVAPLDIGLSSASRRTPDMPLYTLRNRDTGATVQTTDPGRALISGKFADIGKFKGPVLRALAVRPPFFHNGSAADLDAVLDFYDERFAMGLTAAERADLVAFLRTL